MKNNDEHLIAGFLKGNLKEFYEITSWVSAIVKNEYWGLKEDWNDIIQDVRIKLYVNFQQKSFHHSSSLKTYVSRVTKFTCIDYLRKKYRKQEVSIDSIDIEDPADNFSTMVYREQREMMRIILSKISERCRSTLRLVFVEGLSYKKVAAILNIAEGTVRSRVFRCIEKAVLWRKKLLG